MRRLGCLPLAIRVLIVAAAIWLARHRRPPAAVEDDDGWAIGV